MDKEARIWDYVARNASNEIEAGGWRNSYDGKLFSDEEMQEFAADVYIKLKPYLNSTSTSVLEIGCASGITMFKIAPYVKRYIGSDMSQVNLNRNQEKIIRENIDNIHIVNCKADKINIFQNEKIDIIIMNSVCQYFGTEDYLCDVIKKCIQVLTRKGIIYIGDVRDADKKEEFEKSIENYCLANKVRNKKRGDSSELFLPQSFWGELKMDYSEIREIGISSKIGSIKNELTKYRYDVLIHVEK